MAVMELEVVITIVPVTPAGLVQPLPVVASLAHAISAHWLPLHTWCTRWVLLKTISPRTPVGLVQPVLGAVGLGRFMFTHSVPRHS